MGADPRALAHRFSLFFGTGHPRLALRRCLSGFHGNRAASLLRDRATSHLESLVLLQLPIASRIRIVLDVVPRCRQHLGGSALAVKILPVPFSRSAPLSPSSVSCVGKAL